MGSRSWVGGAARALGAAATKAARVTSKTTTRCFIVPFPPEDGCRADCDWASVDLWLGRQLRRGSSRPRSATGTGSALRDAPESEVASATPSRTGGDGETGQMRVRWGAVRPRPGAVAADADTAICSPA